jgi:glyoxylase-like metal-dependent hydrolase (beta-lactamase superfamily II)
MKMRTLPVGALAANCHILWTDPAKALVVDPGADGNRILSLMRTEGVTASLVVTTHGHFDHTGAVGHVVRAHAAAFRVHEAELPIIQMTPAGTRIWGIEVQDVPKPSAFLTHGEVLDVGGLQVRVIHTPGHTPGSTCLYVEGAGLVMTGDTLFQRSVGRSDLPGGDGDQLAESIRDRLYTLPGPTIVHPGHGPTTTVAEEAGSNPFVTA